MPGRTTIAARGRKTSSVLRRPHGCRRVNHSTAWTPSYAGSRLHASAQSIEPFTSSMTVSMTSSMEPMSCPVVSRSLRDNPKANQHMSGRQDSSGSLFPWCDRGGRRHPERAVRGEKLGARRGWARTVHARLTGGSSYGFGRLEHESDADMSSRRQAGDAGGCGTKDVQAKSRVRP